MKFSFCTTCMNRVEHIKKTVPVNLSLIEKFNNKFKNVHNFELSLCNYDSKDDLNDYILNNHINNSNLVYTKIENKLIFNPGHAKNVAHKKSTGDVLINIDADNYITENFLYKVIELFENDMNMITVGYMDSIDSGAYGRMCISRENFYKLGGYFENFIGYGSQDYDLLVRGEKYLNLKKYIFEKEYIDFISHDNLSRVVNYDHSLYNFNNLSEFNNIYSIVDIDILSNFELGTKYMNMNIMNINEYNNIIFGE